MRRSVSRILRAAAVAACVLGASPAAAQQTDADFSAYCRARFPNASYQRFAQPWGTEHACVQGGTRQGIDLAEACRLTTGSPAHEISGARVLCAGTPGDRPAEEAQALSQEEIAGYCRDELPNSTYLRRPGPGGFEHVCRTPGPTGGFSEQRVDLRRLCERAAGTTRFRKEGTQVLCLPEAPPGEDAATPARGGGASPRGPRPRPLDRAPEPRPREPLPRPRDPGEEPGGMPFREPPSARPSLPPGGGDLSQACASLGGRWRSGTIPQVESIRSGAERTKQQRMQGCDGMAGGRERCRDQVRVEQGLQAYFPLVQILQCHLTFAADPGSPARDVRTAKQEACAIEPILRGIREEVNGAGGALPPLGFMAAVDEAALRRDCR